MDWRLIQSGKLDAHQNMAIDEAIFKLYSEKKDTGAGILRLYGWSSPSLSVGYHQKIGKTQLAEFSAKGILVARRPTGGGAVYHQSDLSYAVVVRPAPAEGFRTWCRRINEAIILGLKNLGVAAQLRDKQGGRQNDFFCFVNKSRYDIVFGDKKLAGSAQRVRKEVILQEGSILLEESAGEVKDAISLARILERKVGFDELSACLIRGFEDYFKIRLLPAALSAEERELIEILRYSRGGAGGAESGEFA